MSVLKLAYDILSEQKVVFLVQHLDSSNPLSGYVNFFQHNPYGGLSQLVHGF